ncbi:hypothetical protein [Streptomyces sp. NPDC056670]|uniref:hypothetical protein n=1 Tax=Streptomyces sp. NPDC056670 TaxID=3345904 RepID=UPI0036D1395D
MTHDLHRQVFAGFGVLGVVGHVFGEESEILGQALQRPAGARQPQGSHLGQVPSDGAADPDSLACGERLGTLQEGESVEETGDVLTAEIRQDFASVVALQAQARGEQREGADNFLDAGDRFPATLRESGVSPFFDGFAQPGLVQVGEVEAAGVSEDRAVPHVLVPLAIRCLSRAVEKLDQAVAEPPAVVGELLGIHCGERWDLPFAYMVQEGTEQGLAGMQPSAGPRVKAVENLRHQPVGKPPQADLVVLRDGRRRAPPAGFFAAVHQALAQCVGQALLVGVTVRCGPRPLAVAGCHRTPAEPQQGYYLAKFHELIQRHLPETKLVQVC